MNFIRSLDQLAPTSFVPYSQKPMKSLFGGILTILIYSLCLSYTIYFIVIWRSDQILPKSVNYDEQVNSVEFQTANELLQFSMNSAINPFDPTNCVLIAFVKKIKDGVSESETITWINDQGLIQPDNLELELNAEGHDYHNNSEPYHKQVDIEVQIVRCEQQYLDVNQKCANDETVSAFFQEKNTILMTIWTTQFSIQNKSLYKMPKLVEIIIEPSLTAYYKVGVKSKKLVVDQGILWDRINEYICLSDFTMHSQQLPIQLLQQVEQRSILAEFYFEIDPIQTIQYITYIKIDEILASIGSICTIILFLGQLGEIYNEKKTEEYIQKKIIQTFYPQMKRLAITRNIFGKISIVSLDEYKFDVNKFLKYYESLKTKATQKLSYLNLIYEMSRLQFTIQLMQKREYIMQSHNVGIKISIDPFQNTIIDKDCESDDQFGLLDDDFTLLSKQRTSSLSILPRSQVFSKNYVISKHEK